MQTNGYRIIPVNPTIHGSLGEKAYASLLEVPEKIDIVNIFRRPMTVVYYAFTKITVASSCRPSPLAKLRTSARILSAEASGCST